MMPAVAWSNGLYVAAARSMACQAYSNVQTVMGHDSCSAGVPEQCSAVGKA